MDRAQGTDPRPLAGIRVLVTRPAHQAESLCALIEHRGGIALRLPTVEIAPPRNPSALDAVLSRLDQFDIAVFVSPNAVTCALRLPRDVPARLRIVCVGNGTAQALAERGLTDVVVPARNDSEGMLDLPLMHEISGKQILIVRGEGGRALLAQTLTERGARVEHAECYRRVRPATADRAVIAAIAEGRVDVVIATSADGLRNLNDILRDNSIATALSQLPIIVVSERMRETCRELALNGAVHVAHGASDDAIAAAIEAWRGTGNPL